MLAMLTIAALLTTSYTRPAHALPKYGWEDRYYTGSLGCQGFEVGHDIRTCWGVTDIDGTLSGDYKTCAHRRL